MLPVGSLSCAVGWQDRTVKVKLTYMGKLSIRIQNLFCGLKAGVSRFPITVLFALALTAVGIVLNHVEADVVGERLQFFLYCYPATAMMLSLGLSLLVEERPFRIPSIAAHVLWAGIWVLVSRYLDVINRLPYVLIFAALLALAVISVVVLPFIGRKEDIPMWNFSLTLGCTVAVALLVALVLWGGMSLLLLSFEKLFGLNVNSDLYGDLACFSFFLVAPMLVLQGVPSGRNKHNATPAVMPAFLRGAVRYLFIPLVSLYFLTLYCYAVKIIANWALPDGWVSYLVSASMLLVVLLQLAVRPYRHSQTFGSFAVRLVCVWMPRLMLPLLVLMSVGIVRRVSDYGITVSRAYLIAFNLWCYVACLILWVRNDDHVMWLTVTPVILFILLSVFPVNVSSVVRDSMLRKVHCTLTDSGWNGNVMDDAAYSDWLAGLDGDAAFRADSRLDYLKSKYPFDCISDIMTRDILTGRAQNEEKVERTYISSFRQVLGWVEIPVPEGMSSSMMYEYRSNVGDIHVTEDSVRASFPLNGESTFEVCIPMADLRALTDDYRDEVLADDYREDVLAQKHYRLRYDGTLSDGRPCVFYLNHFSLRLVKGDESMDVSGLLYY